MLLYTVAANVNTSECHVSSLFTNLPNNASFRLCLDSRKDLRYNEHELIDKNSLVKVHENDASICRLSRFI
jgi:hypothetical protein